jgi:hypothetical protein
MPAVEEIGYCCPAAIDRPTERCAHNRVPDVQPRASVDQQPNNIHVVGPHRLMERCGMRMVPFGVITARNPTGDPVECVNKWIVPERATERTISPSQEFRF